MALLEPAFDGHADLIPPGSNCVGVAYSSHAQAIEAGEIRGIKAVALKLADGMGIANAIVIRAQAILLPIRNIVFSG